MLTRSRTRPLHRLVAALALVALVAGVALSAHLALGVPAHLGDVAAVCVIVGTCAAVVTGTFAVLHARRRPLWALASPLPHSSLIPRGHRFRARAGPPPALLQVFRL